MILITNDKSMLLKALFVHHACTRRKKSKNDLLRVCKPKKLILAFCKPELTLPSFINELETQFIDERLMDYRMIERIFFLKKKSDKEEEDIYLFTFQ